VEVESGFGNPCALRAWFGAGGVTLWGGRARIPAAPQSGNIAIIRRSDDGNGSGFVRKWNANGRHARSFKQSRFKHSNTVSDIPDSNTVCATKAFSFGVKNRFFNHFEKLTFSTRG